MRVAGAPGRLDLWVEQSQPMPLSGALACEAGEMLALVGPSGAGKTSLLRVLAGLMRPQRGRVQVGDALWCDTDHGVFVPARQRHVGLVFQHYALMPHLDALGNVALSLLHLPADERRRAAQRWLAHVELAPGLWSRRPAALSGGQQQRVAVARALARQPRLLLLDEPFSALDRLSRQSVYALLADLRRSLDIPIVLVTHDLNEARLLADTLVVMDAGQVLQQGTPAQIHRSPRNARVADLVGIENRFHGRWLGPAETPGWGRLGWWPTPEGGAEGQTPPITLHVRDKGRIVPGQSVSWVVQGDGLQVRLSPPVDAPTPERPVLAVQLTQWCPLGEMSLATLALDAVPGVGLHLSLSGPVRQQLALGQRLWVELDGHWVHVMPKHRP